MRINRYKLTFISWCGSSFERTVLARNRKVALAAAPAYCPRSLQLDNKARGLFGSILCERAKHEH